MKTKLDIKKMMSAIKHMAPKKSEKPKTLDTPGVKDMRQHAIDLGAHDAKEYFIGGAA